MANPANTETNARSTVYGLTIWSPDNTYYIPPIHHILAGHGYATDPANPLTRTRRVPGYPLFYGLHYLLFGEEGSYLVVRYTQTALGALAAVWMGIAVQVLTGNESWARATALLLALCPFTAIFHYYTITESLYPSLVALAVCLAAVAATRERPLFAALAGLITGATVLTRAPVGLLVPALLLLFASNLRARGGRVTVVRRSSAFLAGFAIALAPWVARNHALTGQLIVLEDSRNTVQYGPSLEGLRRWWACWTHVDWTPIQYAHDVLPLLARDDEAGVRRRVAELMRQVPEWVYRIHGREALGSAVGELNACLKAKLATSTASADDLMGRVAAPHPCEEAVAARFDALRATFRRSDPVSYFVIMPFRRVAALLFHSNSSAFGSLNPVTGPLTPAQFAVKAILLALNLALLVSWAAFAFTGAPRRIRALAIFFPLIMVFYLCWGFRIRIEARYLLPAYPFFYVALGWFVHRATARLNGPPRLAPPPQNA